MTEQELQQILNSDMKLWELAETIEASDNAVTKVLDLPYGIGITEVTLEGLSDGSKRREACGSFGEYIRGLVNTAIGDIKFNNGIEVKRHRLFGSIPEGIYISNEWHTMENCTPNCIILVFASEYCDEKDYIRDYDKWKEWRNGERPV